MHGLPPESQQTSRPSDRVQSCGAGVQGVGGRSTFGSQDSEIPRALQEMTWETSSLARSEASNDATVRRRLSNPLGPRIA